MILDSNIIIYSTVPENTRIREYFKKNETALTVSAISKVEVLGYYKLQENEKNKLEHFFQNINTLVNGHALGTVPTLNIRIL